MIGKIARLFQLKGHDDVIRAAEKMIRTSERGQVQFVRQHPDGPDRQVGRGKLDLSPFPTPNVRFLFVGDGIYRERLERQIAAAGLSDYFQFTGLVPPERIPELIAAMDIVVHASLREGLARVLPQALIAGRPAVSFDVDGAREVVIDGETGFLIPPRDVDQLAARLAQLAADPALRDRLGAEGRRRFTDLFRHERMTEQLRALYLKLLEGRPIAGH